MIDRIRQRLTYANVAASLALLFALAGSSYAALSLPRNSVGPAQIRRGAVSSPQVHDRSLRVGDLARSARRALRGRRGPPGAAAVKYFSAVGADGAFRSGNATSGGHTALGSGVYTVGFSRSVTGCAATATLGSVDGSGVPPGRVTLSFVGGRVEVHTFDSAGNPADLPFHLILAC